MTILKFIILTILFSQIMIKTEALKFDPNLVQYKTTSEWRKHKTIIEERIACLEICDKCFTYEDVNFILFNFFYYIIYILYSKDGLQKKSCFNQCLMDKERPIKLLVDWWKMNSFDFDSSICILDIALKYDL